MSQTEFFQNINFNINNFDKKSDLIFKIILDIEEELQKNYEKINNETIEMLLTKIPNFVFESYEYLSFIDRNYKYYKNNKKMNEILDLFKSKLSDFPYEEYIWSYNNFYNEKLDEKLEDDNFYIAIIDYFDDINNICDQIPEQKRTPKVCLKFLEKTKFFNSTQLEKIEKVL